MRSGVSCPRSTRSLNRARPAVSPPPAGTWSRGSAGRTSHDLCLRGSAPCGPRFRTAPSPAVVPGSRGRERAEGSAGRSRDRCRGGVSGRSSMLRGRARRAPVACGFSHTGGGGQGFESPQLHPRDQAGLHGRAAQLVCGAIVVATGAEPVPRQSHSARPPFFGVLPERGHDMAEGLRPGHRVARGRCAASKPLRRSRTCRSSPAVNGYRPTRLALPRRPSAGRPCPPGSGAPRRRRPPAVVACSPPAPPRPPPGPPPRTVARPAALR
jgi:hypothetical protein